MTDAPHTPPPPPNRLLRFLVPVLLAHGLLLAALPYWSGDSDRPSSVSVRLAPLTTPGAAAEAQPPAIATAPPPEAPPPLEPASEPQPVQVTAPVPAVTPAPQTNTAAQPTPRAEATAQSPTTPTPARQSSASPAQTPTPPAAPSPVAPPAPSATSVPDWRGPYRHALRAALASHHHYPARARRFGLSGEVLVAFTIARDGRFSDIHLAHSSQVAMLDQAALDTVRRLGRFRPLPAGYSADGWEVEVPLVYRLD